MNNNAKDIFQWISKIENRSLRELTYLLCRDNLKHPLLSENIYYPIFNSVEEGQYGLAFYRTLSKEQKRSLELVDHLTALGRYAERLLAGWFMLNPNFDLLAFNHQLIHAGATIGEIDFLLWEKINRKAIHLEFALKYYLAIEDGGVMRYIGPKGRDSLEGKSVKLLDHQLKLCSNHSELLDKELRKFHFEPKLLLKGFIFYPYGSEEDYWWIRQKDLNRIELEERNEYYIFKRRRDWIFPYDPTLREKCLKSNKFLDELLDSKQLPLLCLTVSKEGKENLLMVVADQWPREEV